MHFSFSLCGIGLCYGVNIMPHSFAKENTVLSKKKSFDHKNKELQRGNLQTKIKNCKY